MAGSVRCLLMGMMFIQFFIWGAFWVTMGSYLTALGFDAGWIGAAYASQGFGAIVSPIIVGMIADRYFNAEKITGVLHLVGAGLLVWAAQVTEPKMFFVAMLLYMMVYMPTIALTNTIAFSQMKNPDKEFPPIRVLGTIGWIVAGLAITYGLGQFKPGVEMSNWPIYMGAVASVVLGLFAFALPKTPPKASNQAVTLRDVLGLDALSLMKDMSYAVFIISSLLICIPLAFYYNWANIFFNELGMYGTASKMSLGQVSEIFFMLVMPFFFVRLGVKYMLFVGMLAWVARYVLFAYGGLEPSVAWMLLTGILLHGICYDFFFVTGFIYTEQKAPKSIRANAQGFLTIMTLGIGMLIGFYGSPLIVGKYEQSFTAEELVARIAENESHPQFVNTQTRPFFKAVLDQETTGTATGAACVAMIQKIDDAPKKDAEGIAAVATESLAQLKQLIADGKIPMAPAKEGQEAKPVTITLHDWKQIWRWPAVMALIVAILFVVLFKDNGKRAEEEDVSGSEAPMA